MKQGHTNIYTHSTAHTGAYTLPNTPTHVYTPHKHTQAHTHTPDRPLHTIQTRTHVYMTHQISDTHTQTHKHTHSGLSSHHTHPHTFTHTLTHTTYHYSSSQRPHFHSSVVLVGTWWIEVLVLVVGTQARFTRARLTGEAPSAAGHHRRRQEYEDRAIEERARA